METITLNTKQVLQVLISYLNAGARLHHFNGGQWYIACSDYSVVIIDSSMGDYCTLDFFSGEKAFNYLQSSSNCNEENAFSNAIRNFEQLVLS